MSRPGTIGAHLFRQTLRDRCYIDTRTAGNEWGADRAAIDYTAGETVTPCRLVEHEAKEYMTAGKVRIAHVAVFLPADTELAADDRIRVTQKYGKVLAVPELYAVVAVHVRGHTVRAECEQAKGQTAK